MRIPLIRSALSAAALVALVAQPVSAAGRVSIDLTVDAVTGEQTFTASGAFCATGWAENGDAFFAGGGQAATFHLDKRLHCGDGTGTLTIRVNAATAHGSGHDQGGWSVESGTGAYATAAGGGKLVGDYVPNGIVDHYTGFLR
jgi:hypothetical protein